MSLHDALLAKAFGGGSGGASSWNDLTDKPFGEEAVQIVWKSATDVTDYVTPHGQRNIFYKITDEVFDISDLDGAYFVVDMGNGSTTKVDLNNVKEIEGGCSQGNAFCSIYDTIVNLGIASDGKPDTFPSTGTYLGMSRPYDVQIVIPKRIKKIDDKYLPAIDGGSASIDVTAQVGQTIIVKEVDASGKPTKWESADYQPRTHWSELVQGDLVPHTAFTPVLNEAFGMLVYNLPTFDFEAGKTYTVVYDGVEYTGTAEAGVFNGLNIVTVGNAYLTTGTPTAEPFIVAKITDVNMLSVVCLTEEESHTIRIIGEKTVYNRIPYEYLEYRVNIGVNSALAGYEVNVNWDELKAAIRAGMTVTGRYAYKYENGEYRLETYRLAKAEIDIDPTTTVNNATDCLYFVSGLKNGNLLTFSSGSETAIEVFRYADGRVETKLTSN